MKNNYACLLILTLSIIVCSCESNGELNSNIPIADAGENQVALKGTTVTLDGRNSYDPDEDKLTYNWEFVDTPPRDVGILSDSSSPTPYFVPEMIGDYSFYLVKLVVNDGDSNSEPDYVEITVASTNSCETNDMCAGQFFCLQASNTCDGLGICFIRPNGCNGISSPVCGCDGNTYNSYCEAYGQGVNILSQGSCT